MVIRIEADDEFSISCGQAVVEEVDVSSIARLLNQPNSGIPACDNSRQPQSYCRWKRRRCKQRAPRAPGLERWRRTPARSGHSRNNVLSPRPSADDPSQVPAPAHEHRLWYERMFLTHQRLRLELALPSSSWLLAEAILEAVLGRAAASRHSLTRSSIVMVMTNDRPGRNWIGIHGPPVEIVVRKCHPLRPRHDMYPVG